jgi:hypothetical protein
METLVIIGVAIFLCVPVFFAYLVYRCFLDIRHALQDMQITGRSTAEWSHSTATQALHTKANVKYLVEYLEARFVQSDELRRQILLQQVQRHALSQETTPIASITPHTPIPAHTAWIGGEALKAWRATRLK